jgi:hypothetical protein
MLRKTLTYGAVLIGLYLGVYYASGSGRLIQGATNGATGVIKALQGR